MENNNLNDLPEFENKIKKLNGGILSYLGKQGPLLIILLPILVFFVAILSAYFKTTFPIVFLSIFIALAYSYLDSNARRAFMERFAKICGYQYQESEPINSIDSPYLKIGHSRSIDDVVAGNYQGYPVKIFNFNCLIGYGKSKKRVNFTTAQINYKKPLMHIFLDARHNFLAEDSFFSTEEHNTNKNHEILKLEGDFNKYFTLYAPKEFEIETLQILTPDIMAELIDHSKNFSLEFFNNNLYIYSRKAIENGNDLYALYSLARLMIIKLAPKLERIKFESINSINIK